MRNTRRDFRFGTSGIKEISPTITTVKSKMFHPSLRYDFLCRIKPKAIILRMHSAVYIIVKILSMSYNI
jgi:hypothetical protein